MADVVPLPADLLEMTQQQLVTLFLGADGLLLELYLVFQRQVLDPDRDQIAGGEADEDCHGEHEEKQAHLE